MTQTHWAIVVMFIGFGICGIAGICEMRRQRLVAIAIGGCGILTWFGGFLILVWR